MNSVMHKNGGYTVEKDVMVTLEGGKAISLKLLLQGKLDVFISPSHKKFPTVYEDLKHKSYRLFELEQNIFISANDILLGGKNSLSIAAAADCSLFAYEADNMQSAWSIIQTQKDYGAYVINSICTLICSSYQALQKVSSYCLLVKTLYENLSAFYMALVEEYSLEAISGKLSEKGTSRLAFLKDNSMLIPLHFSKQFVEAVSSDHLKTFSAMPDTQEKIMYFSHMYNLPADLRKTFFAADHYITASHITDASKCLEQILLELRHTFSCLEETIELLYSENEGNAYKAFLKTANEMHARGLDHTSAQDASSYIRDKLREISEYIEFEYRHKTDLDFKYLEHSHTNSIAALGCIKSGSDVVSSISGSLNGMQSLPEELNDSAVKILEYSEITDDIATCFMMNLTAFRNLRDKLSTDEASRNIRNAIVDTFFDVYKAVFRKAYHLKDNSRLIKMFLSYGYMDEKLLDNDQILAIYKLAGIENAAGTTNVHYMREWFTKIIEMEKNPSVNQFGQDYNDVFRELKKHGQVADKDKMAYDNDIDGRLTFETNNMFRTNHKLCQGQISLYFPILHRDMAPRNPIRSHITPDLVKEKLNRILEIDYSAFHREINYRDPSKGIEKELVMMSVIPDFILMPVYGSRAIMWQEITGRVRSTPGRLLIPVFTDENLDDMLVKLVGNFRWDLCRTMMGAAWNDVTQSSLTSEYTDYIQFCRKNHDLTDDAKERVKSLIVKHHNKTRDIFTSDYELWINNEAKGNPRLNKVSRGILFKHCPFSKGIREQLERQPMYIDMITLMKNLRAKQARELENRYKHYHKANGTLDTILENNLEFYRDM